MSAVSAVIPLLPIKPQYFGFLNTFGILVAIGVLVAAHLIRNFADREGLDEDVIQSAIVWAVSVGFVTSHVFDVLFYQPGAIQRDPLILLKFWQGISSVGGMIGGTLGFLWCIRRINKRDGTHHSALRYADAMAVGVVPGWIFGRLGCTLVHDHPGKQSDFVLAMVFPDGVARHDLGFYEFLWLLVIGAVVWALVRWRNRPTGVIVATAPLMYGPVRFFLDFLRVDRAHGGDTRYFGLTPAHYVSVAITIVGVALMVYAVKRRGTTSAGAGTAADAEGGRAAGGGGRAKAPARKARRRNR